MKLFTSNDFSGRWPVGTAAIVIANNIEEAKELLIKELLSVDLQFDGTIVEVEITSPKAIILHDGDY